ncbi:coenzyme A pyrophosphatase [Corynebacterium sp. BCW_4722]|nr:coenzyme A pyrophosphatase [Corynebacterium sp. BCW_4722]
MADVQLRPEAAPDWLAPLVRALERGEEASITRKLLATRVRQKEGKDQAAVLICFTGERLEDAAVLITHRTPTMRSHSGQMAFPGGHIDATDAGPVDAALREAEEETGLARERVVPLTLMQAATTGGSNRRVRPVVAYAPRPGEVYSASPAENDDVFFVPLAEFVNPENRENVTWHGWVGPAFWAGCYLVWGFTGVLVAVVLELGGWVKPWDERPRDLAEALERSCNNEQ